MGTALAHMLASNGSEVRIWDFFPEVVDEINSSHRNTRYLKGIELGTKVRATSSQTDCVNGASMLVIALPAAFVMDVLQKLQPVLQPEVSVLNVSKGVLLDTHEPIAQRMASFFGAFKVMMLGGPAIANEFARGMATSVVLGREEQGDASLWQTALQNTFFQVSVTDDFIGVVQGGILKNVYAILLGYLDASGGGRNLEAAVLNAALREMAEISVAMGAKRETVYGLAGLGDLVATAFSQDSHNRNFGRKLGAGLAAEGAGLALPEGARAVHSVCHWAQIAKAKAPLAHMVQRIVRGKRPAFAELFSLI